VVGGKRERSYWMKNIDEYIMGPRFNHGKRDEITTHSDPSNNIVLCLSEKKI
jgi:hypothetical protein